MFQLLKKHTIARFLSWSYGLINEPKRYHARTRGGSWPPLPGAVSKCKTHRYVAIIEWFYQSLETIPRDYKEIMLFGKCKADARAAESSIPTSGRIFLFIIAFLRYLLYYWNLLAFCIGRPAPRGSSPDKCRLLLKMITTLLFMRLRQFSLTQKTITISSQLEAFSGYLRL